MPSVPDLDDLAGSVGGEVLRPGDIGYDAARSLWNGMIDRRPAVIVRPLDTGDVCRALRFASSHGLRVTAKGGGHNVAGRALNDGGMVVDLSAMRAVTVDVAARRVRVEPGVTLGEMDHATQAHGLATTGGVDSRTGVAGLTLGGGIGYLARRFGLAIDNLEEVEVVLADGSLVRANEEQNPDLFWALRGGGGRAGVVTAFTFRLHEVGPEVMTVQAFHRIEDAGEVLRYFRALTAAAPDELAVYALIIHLPPIPAFPEELHGAPALVLVGCHSGERQEAEAAVAAIGAFGAPLLADVRDLPYTTLQSAFDAGTPDGARYYYKSQVMAALPDAAIDTLLDELDGLPGPFSMVGIEPLGGAIGRVARDATAFPHRDAAYNLGIWAGWTDPADDARTIGWTRALHDALTPYGTGGAYVNYLPADDLDRRAVAFGPNADRLREVERRFDPDGLFRPAQVPA